MVAVTLGFSRKDGILEGVYREAPIQRPPFILREPTYRLTQHPRRIRVRMRGMCNNESVCVLLRKKIQAIFK